MTFDEWRGKRPTLNIQLRHVDLIDAPESQRRLNGCDIYAAGFKPLFEKINVRLIAYSGLFHGLAEIIGRGECFCLIDIFHREKQQHFVWVAGVAEKMFLL